MADVLDVAASHLGEHGNTFWNYCNNTNQAWCAAFISTVLAEAGEGDAISNRKMTSVAEYRDYFKSKNAYFTKGTYIPQPGDIVIMKTDSGAMGSHVAIVSKVYADGSFDTIEGNRGGKGPTGNTVITSNYSGKEAYISGYGVPVYKTPPVGGGDYSSIGSGTGDGTGENYTGGNGLGVGLYEYDDYVVREGDTLESIALAHNIPLDLLLSYNNLNRWDTPAPGTTLVIPKIDTQLDNPWDAGTSNVERAHTMTTKVYHPVIKAEFYTEGGALAASTETMDERVYGDKELDFDIISCATQRSLGADCPSMSITLTNRRDWYNILSPNDLVIIKMRRPEFGDDADLDEEEQEVFIGVIDDIRKSLDFSSGQPKRAVQVTARGMGKAFVNFNVGLIKNITIDTGTGFMGTSTGNPLNGTETEDQLMQISMTNSAGAIGIVWDAFVGKAIRYEFYNGKCLEDYIAYESKPHAFEYLSDFKTYSQYTGSLWNFIKELANAPFNETFWEIKSGKAVLTHRPSPFDPEDWKSLKRTVIRDDDIVTDATGRSDLETYTVYIVNLRLLGADISNLYNPLWYRPYYDKYGITQLEVTSTYEIDPLQGDDTEAMRLYTEELFNWNIKNNVFANGQIVVKGRASYKIGETIVLEYNGLEFYVEGVSHNFTVYGGWTTTLSVTRGIAPEERFTAPWGMGQEMTSDVMSKIISLTDGVDVDWTQVTDPGAFSAGGGAFGSGSLAAVGGAGSEIDIPASLQQCGCIPDDYTSYTRNWASGTNQRRLYEIWKSKGTSSGGLAMLDGRVFVAMADGVIGQTGDIVDIYLDNGTTIPAILADEKGSDRQNQYGHWQSYSASGGIHTEGVSLVEWERTGNQKELTQTLKNNNWYLAKVTKVVNKGSYFDS